MIKIDFSNVVEEKDKAIPPGEYNAFVFEIKQKVSQAGNNMLQIVFSIVDNPYKGVKFSEFFVLTQNSLWRLKSFLTALGIDAKGVVEIDTSELLGKLIKVVLEVDEKGYNKIKKFFKADKYKEFETENDPF